MCQITKDYILVGSMALGGEYKSQQTVNNCCHGSLRSNNCAKTPGIPGREMYFSVLIFKNRNESHL